MAIHIKIIKIKYEDYFLSYGPSRRHQSSKDHWGWPNHPRVRSLRLQQWLWLPSKVLQILPWRVWLFSEPLRLATSVRCIGPGILHWHRELSVPEIHLDLPKRWQPIQWQSSITRVTRLPVLQLWTRSVWVRKLSSEVQNGWQLGKCLVAYDGLHFVRTLLDWWSCHHDPRYADIHRVRISRWNGSILDDAGRWRLRPIPELRELDQLQREKDSHSTHHQLVQLVLCDDHSRFGSYSDATHGPLVRMESSWLPEHPTDLVDPRSPIHETRTIWLQPIDAVSILILSIRILNKYSAYWHNFHQIKLKHWLGNF